MERRKWRRRDWVVTRDEVGRSVLEWKVDYRHTRRRESDPCARTYDFLRALEAPSLALEDDKPLHARGCNPYDTTSALSKKRRRK